MKYIATLIFLIAPVVAFAGLYGPTPTVVPEIDAGAAANALAIVAGGALMLQARRKR